MVNLNRDSVFSDDELLRAKIISPAIAQYFEIIERSPTDFSSQLRIERHTLWLTAAISTVLKKYPAKEVCHYWSGCADEIVRSAWRQSGCKSRSIALFAMGKWGSNELNLSSDIDFFIVSENSPTLEDVSAIKLFLQILNEVTEFRFCFRTDMDLRPGGRASPLLSSLNELENYYWSLGATWERLALVRMRPIAGSTGVFRSVQKIVNKFVYRKHLDYSLLEDLKHLRTKIHSHYYSTVETQINLKLNPGGIRDIELFIHALQVIHGGRIESLRTVSTSEAAEILISCDLYKKEHLQLLINVYWQLRQLENYVQSIDDSHSHIWDEERLGPLDKGIKLNLSEINSIVEDILGRPERQKQIPSSDSELIAWAKDLGFTDDFSITKIQELLHLTVFSTRTFQDENLRLKILHLFLNALANKSLDKSMGIATLVDFIKSTRVKSGFFSLLVHQPKIIDELAILFGSSPFLGGIIAARPELLDSYVYKAQANLSESVDTALEQLVERKLLNDIMSGHQLLSRLNLDGYFEALSTTADSICQDILTISKSQVGSSDIRILALGKWGGRELGLRSDLDFIFVTKNPPTETDHKIARRFLKRLTEQHRGGSIYEIDVRLKPSGKGGPIIVDESGLIDYLENKSEVWERQSYLKSRFLNDNNGQTSAIHRACTARSLSSQDFQELRRIRDSLMKNSSKKIEIKYGAGGLIQIEFALQIDLIFTKTFCDHPGALQMLSALARNSAAWSRFAEKLTYNYQFLRLVEQLYQLTTLTPGSSLDPESEGFHRLYQLLKPASGDLGATIIKIQNQNVDILKQLDPRDLNI